MQDGDARNDPLLDDAGHVSKLTGNHVMKSKQSSAIRTAVLERGTPTAENCGRCRDSRWVFTTTNAAGE